ncbi:lipoprotein-releasing ABC transporter permease subunit LolC [Candidatus Steffania adelgidicola]|uniref:lipoprotein-releasing ABC transporter permease subunit LolC n=1 Tax=Candidatus Steffania adelgidicola TaxID=1076626 RepID=UPI001D0030E4|nr:lipoprotein-releasing ABC transporter permease subunit LolC [Candidatus Steffania adelgidicola]UDG79615.1 Lipoprotein-releasing system transmembrane protein LolC [Candidatus Steffania adelgidicola]
MYQPVVLYIGFRYMREKEPGSFACFVSWLSTIAITLGVMAMVTVLSVMNGFERELEKNILGLIPQALLTSPQGGLDPKNIKAVGLNALLGVTHVSPLTTSDVMLQSASGVAMGVMLGINQNDPEPLSHYFLKVRQDDLIAGQYRVILGYELANTLNVKRGDRLRLIMPGMSQFTPVGRIPTQRLFTVIGTFTAHSEVDGYQLLVNQDDASRLMRYPSGHITGWRLWLKKPLAVDQLCTQLLPHGLVWHDWRERKGELFQAVRMEKNMMGLLLSLIIIVAVFNIITSLGLVIMEKQVEVAILKTQGMTRQQVILVFIAQGAFRSIVGAILGTCLGVLLSCQLHYFIPGLGPLIGTAVLPVVIEPLQVAAITFSTITMSLLSTIYPSWHAASVHPAEVLRYE